MYEENEENEENNKVNYKTMYDLKIRKLPWSKIGSLAFNSIKEKKFTVVFDQTYNAYIYYKYSCSNKCINLCTDIKNIMNKTQPKESLLVLLKSYLTIAS